MYSSTMSLFSFDVIDKNGFLFSPVKTLVQRVVRAVVKHLDFGKDQASSAPVTK